MLPTKRTIVLDYDDTLVNSNEIVINILNKRNGTNKTVSDLKDWGYKSIDKNITKKDVIEIYESEEFWNQVPSNRITNAMEFIAKFKDEFDYIICSCGTTNNLLKKAYDCAEIQQLTKANITFYPLLIDENGVNKIDKSAFDFSDTYMMIDDNIDALLSTNAKTKVLFKNYNNFIWNEIPANETNLYCVNDFKEISDMIEFDLSLGG